MSRNVFVLLSMYALIVIWFCVRVIISGLRRGANDIFDLLECNAALIGGYFRTFRDNLSVPSSWVKQSRKNPFLLDCLALEGGTDRLSRNVGY
jgi:hypothetical protein